MLPRTNSFKSHHSVGDDSVDDVDVPRISRLHPRELNGGVATTGYVDDCSPTLNDCNTVSDNCFGKGVCTEIYTGLCWKCSCQSGYSGPFCQYEDLSEAFVMIGVSSLLFVLIVAVLAVWFLRIDLGKDEWIYGNAPHSKMD